VSGAKYQGVADAVCHADAGREPALADFDAAIFGNVPGPADQDLVPIRLVAFDAAIGACGHRKVLPSQAVIQRQLGSHTPAVAEVDAVKQRAQMVLVGRLISPSVKRGESEQKGGITVELVAARASA